MTECDKLKSKIQGMAEGTERASMQCVYDRYCVTAPLEDDKEDVAHPARPEYVGPIL